MTENNLKLWDKVRTPDPSFVKEFNRGGGFKGSATNTQYIVRLATEIFGINGVGWGIKITDEKYVEGGHINETDRAIIHTVRGCVWYIWDGERRETSEQYGQTTFVGSNKYGVFTDEEAPKKSITDMMLKCLSLLGFSADIFLGMWDDNKYVNDVRKKFAKPQQPQTSEQIDEKVTVFIKAVNAYCDKSLDEFLAKKASMEKNAAQFPPDQCEQIEREIRNVEQFLKQKEGK